MILCKHSVNKFGCIIYRKDRIITRKVNYFERAASMESYIKNTLGLYADIKAWGDKNTLPDELREEREFSILEICGITCLVITMATSEFQMSVFLKERQKIQEHCGLPVVICFDRITSYQRKCLIENGQAFIVPENQFFMPFLGIALQEHFKTQTVAGKRLTAMAQYILLFFLYDETEEYRSKLEISQVLDISLMNVTRGVQELEELGFLVTRKKGRSSMVAMSMEREALWNEAKRYFRNPVQKRLFVKKQDWILDLPKAGREAWLAQTGSEKEKNSLGHCIRAIEKRTYLKKADTLTVIDPDWDTKEPYIELEVWRYAPARFTDKQTVDSISLSLSLEGERDGGMKLNI